LTPGTETKAVAHFSSFKDCSETTTVAAANKNQTDFRDGLNEYSPTLPMVVGVNAKMWHRVG
jgi:hypothetical protein